MGDDRYILACDVSTDKSKGDASVIINVRAARNIVRESDGTVVFWFDGQHSLSFGGKASEKVWKLAMEYCGVKPPVEIPPITAGQS